MSALAPPAERAELIAAVLTDFDPLTVFGTGSLVDDEHVDAIDALAASCDEVEVAGHAPRWSMRTENRQQVLAAMAARPDFGTLLGGIEVPSDDLFANYLRDGLRGVDLGAEIAAADRPLDLDRLLRAVRVLRGVPGAVAGDVERRVLNRIASVEQDSALRAVVPTRFVGREREYAALVDYRGTVLDTATDWVPAFVLLGPGGVGKSALVSKFVSDQRHEPGAAPLIYLDFDRAALSEAAPLDLTFEFTRQLGLADPHLDERLADLRRTARSLLGGRENPGAKIGASFDALRELGSLLVGWSGQAEAVTVVLDTFEEVAIRGVTPVRDVLGWIADLRNIAAFPQIHLVVCGRVVVPDTPQTRRAEVESWFNYQQAPQELADLATADAVELLTGLGVGQELAVRFPPVFGGNPLVLKLIHRFVAANDLAEIERLLADGEQSLRSGAPTGEVALRFVYERILNRIKKPRVRALAYPGVVLRQMTPDLILEVLAPVCPGIDLTTPDQAGSAFDELAEHVWLVDRIAADTVEHRADVRRLLVPGLERSSEIDTAAIHRAAAQYYRTHPDRVEEIYHRGFLDDIPVDLDESEADGLIGKLGADLTYWPAGARARIMWLAGRHGRLTEDEMATLPVEWQQISRAARLGKMHASADTVSAEYEEARLTQLADGETSAAIPDSRWALLFERGDFEFMTESSRVLSAFDRYFAGGHQDGLTDAPTHEHPWHIALATFLLERSERLPDATLRALETGSDDVRLYAAALAAMIDDRSAQTRLVQPAPVRTEKLRTIDTVVVCQAAGSRGDLDGTDMRFVAYSADLFRLSHLAAIAAAAGNVELAENVETTVARYRAGRPDTSELNRFRAMLGRVVLPLGGARELRAAPTTLPFLYGVVRTIAAPLERNALLDVVAELQGRSVFWPADQTATTLDSTMRTALTPRDLTAVIETADRCGLIVDLIDAVSSRARTRLSSQLATGIRRIERVLFPFAKARAELPGVR